MTGVAHEFTGARDVMIGKRCTFGGALGSGTANTMVQQQGPVMLTEGERNYGNRHSARWLSGRRTIKESAKSGYCCCCGRFAGAGKLTVWTGGTQN